MLQAVDRIAEGGEPTMKTLAILGVLIVLTSMPVHPQEAPLIDEKSGKPMLCGEISRAALETDSNYAEWFKPEYENYQVNASLLPKLDLEDVQAIIILGTWCSDTKRELPRFFKILDASQFDSADVTLYAVNREKKAEGVDLSSYAVERVPTFVFFRRGREIGRIVESPSATLEDDMVEILGHS